ncbi:MAG: hypothetical protein HY290_13400 [Planctomycetia bacterium]|nr:hypothetical protein [Planctomycetia bacterium]
MIPPPGDLSETERLVLAAEQYLNSADFKQRFPESGEDVKVMASRRGRLLLMTVAIRRSTSFCSP